MWSGGEPPPYDAVVFLDRASVQRAHHREAFPLRAQVRATVNRQGTNLLYGDGDVCPVDPAVSGRLSAHRAHLGRASRVLYATHGPRCLGGASHGYAGPYVRLGRSGGTPSQGQTARGGRGGPCGGAGALRRPNTFGHAPTGPCASVPAPHDGRRPDTVGRAGYPGCLEPRARPRGKRRVCGCGVHGVPGVPCRLWAARSAGKPKWGLRPPDGSVDVSRVALKLGGRGHPRSAGSPSSGGCLVRRGDLGAHP